MPVILAWKGRGFGDRRHQNPGTTNRVLLNQDQEWELAEALRRLPKKGNAKLAQVGRVGRGEDRQGHEQQEADGMGVSKKAGAQPEGG
jgi:hypothetical protein